MQWNFLDGPGGVNAPAAWDNLIADGRPGGAGVIVAVVDTGVAYRNHKRFKRDPDLTTRLRRGYDFVDNDRYPLDTNGHGTHVASTIAEATNNGLSLTGLAYGATIMPVRVLDIVTAVRQQSEWGKLKDRIVTSGRRLKYQEEHREIVSALKARDDVRAQDAIIAHLQHARRNLFGYSL